MAKAAAKEIPVAVAQTAPADATIGSLRQKRPDACDVIRPSNFFERSPSQPRALY